MKLQFDANQQFQLDAVAAVADLFDGQQRGEQEFSVIKTSYPGELFSGLEQTEIGVGNRLLLDDGKLRQNTRTIQERNDIEIDDPSAPLEAWDLFDVPADKRRTCPHFSVERETGTGKTYVYLRTIFELSQRYGFQKFIIVVPSVAIREGVLKNIEITGEHFRALYNNLPFEYFVYDAKRVNRLRQFATSNTLQILIINIDAFRKNFTGTETEQRSNVIYRLDPVRAFELRLVKQIVVASVETEDSANDPFVRVEAVEYKTGFKARLRMLSKAVGGPKERPSWSSPETIYSTSPASSRITRRAMSSQTSMRRRAMSTFDSTTAVCCESAKRSAAPCRVLQ